MTEAGQRRADGRLHEQHAQIHRLQPPDRPARLGQPVVLGSDMRLFDEITRQISLELAGSGTLSTGVLSVTYLRPVRSTPPTQAVTHRAGKHRPGGRIWQRIHIGV
jgi:hypothetical protein